MTSGVAHEPASAALPPAVTEFFEQDDWVVEVDDAGVATFAVRGAAGEWYGQVWWLAATEQLLVYSILPFPVPEQRRDDVALLMGRINAQLALASFEIDLADGEARCRTGVAVGLDDLRPDLVRRAVHANVHAVDRYLPAVVRTVAGSDPRTSALVV